MSQQKNQGTSLLEVIIALCIFSLSITVISSQIELILSGMNFSWQHVIELYARGV